jgi:hypothetical protein
VAFTFRHGDRPIDGITIQRAIGRGGFGEVYYAVTDAGKEVAVKYLRDNAEVELRGIAHVMNLSSPHLIKIFDVRRNESDEPFVLMEYVSGPSLRDVLRAEPGGLSLDKAAYFVRGIAQGLGHLHARGVVHRDLKPGNIFYDDGYVKIGDYGLSKHMSVSQHSGQTVSVGTVHYMAPEIGTGRYTKLIDVYALGVILYEMLVGRPPFTGGSLQEVLVRQFRDEPDVSVLPRQVAPIVAKALEKDPADRYQSADEFVDDLMQVTGVSARVSRFNHSALSGVPRQASVGDELSPAQRPTLTLDARAVPSPAGKWNKPYEVEPPYRDRYAAPRTTSFMVPFVALLILDGIGLLFAFAAATASLDWDVYASLEKMLFALGVIPSSILLYKFWATLPAGWRRTTPGRAVGLCFVPLFNFYWLWVAFHGLVIDLNRYRRTFAADLPQLRHGWMVLFWITFFIANGMMDEGVGPGAFIFSALAVLGSTMFYWRVIQLCRALLWQRAGQAAQGAKSAGAAAPASGAAVVLAAVLLAAGPAGLSPGQRAERCVRAIGAENPIHQSDHPPAMTGCRVAKVR